MQFRETRKLQVQFLVEVATFAVFKDSPSLSASVQITQFLPPGRVHFGPLSSHFADMRAFVKIRQDNELAEIGLLPLDVSLLAIGTER